MDAGIAFHLDIVGTDTLNGQMQRCAAELGLGDRVTFHGFLSHRVLHPLLERAHVLLVSSRHETGPLVVLEAAVAGVPTVGTNVGHIADWAPHAAVAVPVGDPAGLARAAMDLLADEERRLELAHQAQARARREDADWTAAQVVQSYRRILDATGLPGENTKTPS
jgi:glycosyltransferase involved in cell wall biosynthesis